MVRTLEPHFRAHVRLLTPAEGGRKTPANFPGYRPDMKFDGDNRGMYGAGYFRPVDVAPGAVMLVAPGEEVDLDILLRNDAPEYMPDLVVGKTFDLHEGNTVIGTGVVTTVFSE
jgi:translation elongation factor EF-Tu-like GTPase